jgi:hypothetical protein
VGSSAILFDSFRFFSILFDWENVSVSVWRGGGEGRGGVCVWEGEA